MVADVNSIMYLLQEKHKGVRLKIARFIANHLPKRIVVWGFYRMLYHSTSGQYSHTDVAAITWQEVIDRFCLDNKIK